jgi:hypothetical protein
MVQARSRDGDYPTRRDRSQLGNGPNGWIQIANFILTGLLVIAVAALSYHQPPDRRIWSNP